MAIVLAILAPIAASLIQFAISRSREYLADASGARYCGSPSPSPPRSASSSHGTSAFPCRTATPPRRKCSSSPPSSAAAWPSCSAPTPTSTTASPVSAKWRASDKKSPAGRGIAPRPPGEKRSGRLWKGSCIRLNSWPRRPSQCISSTSRKKMGSVSGANRMRNLFCLPEQSDTPLATNRKEYVSFLRSTALKARSF